LPRLPAAVCFVRSPAELPYGTFGRRAMLHVAQAARARSGREPGGQGPVFDLHPR
jgi:hypothetical protein